MNIWRQLSIGYKFTARQLTDMHKLTARQVDLGYELTANMKTILIALLLAVVATGCVHDFVGNSPMERQHRKAIGE